MFTKRPQLCYAMTAVVRQDGGIASVNRNVLRGLVGGASQAGLTHVVSLYDLPGDRPDYLPADVGFDGCGGSRRHFACAVIAQALQKRWLLVDHVTLAKPLLPLITLGWRRLMVIAHGSEAWRKIRPSSRRIFKRATLTLTNSQFTLRRMHAALGEFAGIACPLGLSVDFPLLSEPPTPKPAATMKLRCADGVERLVGNQALLLVGRMHSAEREKGTVELMGVLPRVLQKFPETQLIFCGDGDDRAYLEKLALQQDLGAKVFFPGRVSNELLAQIYQQCYAYVMPSRQEGFGLVYLEAMNAAKPCIGSVDDGATDVIVDQETGYLIVHDEQSKGLYTAIIALLESPAHARQMGLHGFRRLHATFTAGQFHQRFLRAIDAAMGCVPVGDQAK